MLTIVVNPCAPTSDVLLCTTVKLIDEVYLEWIAKSGHIDVHELAKRIYGEDTSVTRQRIYVTITRLRKTGMI